MTIHHKRVHRYLWRPLQSSGFNCELSRYCDRHTATRRSSANHKPCSLPAFGGKEICAVDFYYNFSLLYFVFEFTSIFYTNAYLWTHSTYVFVCMIFMCNYVRMRIFVSHSCSLALAARVWLKIFVWFGVISGSVSNDPHNYAAVKVIPHC